MMSLRLLVLPGLRDAQRGAGLDQEAATALLLAIHRRFLSLTYGAMVLFVLTGVTMLSQNVNYLGFANLSNLWSQVILLKHVAVGTLIVTTAYTNRVILPQMEHLARRRAVKDMERWHERHSDMLDLNLSLGLVILALTAIATAIPPRSL